MNKSQLVAQIATKTGKSGYKAEQALNTVLDGIKHGLKHGREVDLGPKLGRLKVIERKPKRVIKENLLGGKYNASILEVHKKHPKSVRLLGRNRDLSDDPKPTIVTPAEPELKPVPTRSTSFRVVVPGFRPRPNMPRRRT